MSKADDLRAARRKLAKVQRNKPGDKEAYEQANSEVVKAEQQVRFGRLRGWD